MPGIVRLSEKTYRIRILSTCYLHVMLLLTRDLNEKLLKVTWKMVLQVRESIIQGTVCENRNIIFLCHQCIETSNPDRVRPRMKK